MEPFKNLFSRELIAAIGGHLAAHDPAFDRAGFEGMAGDGLEALELKARSAQITRALDAHLPADFAAACDLMLAALHPYTGGVADGEASDGRGLRGWAVMPMADVVAGRGLADFDRAMATLAGGGYMAPAELVGARKVLNAAALTYVAAFVTSLLTLLYWAYRLGLFGGGRRD